MCLHLGMAKLSVKFPNEMIEELKEESARLDRTRSWIMQRAWVLARERVKEINK
jgi:uncharacterized small protein (TIGR04563 family)